MTPESKEEIRRLLDGGDNGTIIESEEIMVGQLSA
jgi:hypothetical protein